MATVTPYTLLRSDSDVSLNSLNGDVRGIGLREVNAPQNAVSNALTKENMKPIVPPKGCRVSHESLNEYVSVKKGISNILIPRWHGERRVYFDTGILKIQEIFDNGQRDGVQKEYYDTGKVKGIMNWNKGKPHGEVLGYYPTGGISGISNMTNGKVDGEVKLYYENGNIKQISHYKDGLSHGKCECYYSNKQLKFIHRTINGENHGLMKCYTPDGTLTYQRWWLKGKEQSEEVTQKLLRQYKHT